MLDRYHHERRYSTEQAFKTTKFYDRHRSPGENYGDWQWLKESEVPWDEDLKGQALAEILNRLRVVRQSDASSEHVPGAASPSTSR